MMPMMHAENLALQDRAMAITDDIVAGAPAFMKPMLGMAVEQSRKYHDIIARFGRFPHRNEVLGRTSTPEEEAFLVDWKQKMAPKGSDKLPS
jgi:uncharacterized protein (DUF924 family)